MFPAEQPNRISFNWAREEDTAVQELVSDKPSLADFTARLASMKGIVVFLMLAGLAFLVWFSVRISAMRIFHADECGEIYVAKALTLGRERLVGLQHISLFQVLLSWVIAGGHRAIDLFVTARFVMLEIFWLNILLIAVATGEKLFSLRGLAALLGAATLAPIWDNGIEIRHDNLFLTGILMIWCAVRVRPSGPQSYFVSGALTVLLQFIAFNAFAYCVPVSLATLILPPPGHKAPRWKLCAGWLAGVVAAFVAVRIWYGVMGLWAAKESGSGLFSPEPTGGNQFGAGVALNRLSGQTPLLFAITAAALGGVIIDVRRRGRTAITWEGNLPETMLFFVALGALLISPMPFPQSLLCVIPYAYIFGFRYGASMWKEISGRPVFAPALGAVLVFTHFVPFGLATKRHLNWTNSRQERLMRLAEDLTDPIKDPVWDATGMVPTRTMVQSLAIKAPSLGAQGRLHKIFAADPAAVLIPNYRADALLPEIHNYIRGHYVSMADDFWVLGKVLPPGGGQFEIIHPGKYRVSSLSGSDLCGTYPEGFKAMTTPELQGKVEGSLDRAPLQGQTIELGAGLHRIETNPDTQAAVVWVGPRLERIHRLPQSDHRFLFMNAY